MIYDSISFIGKKLCGDLCPSIHDGRVYEEWTIRIVHTINQRIAEGWFAAFAAEGFVGIQELAAFPRPGIISRKIIPVHISQIILGRCSQAKLISDEVFKHGTAVSADGTMTFICNY